MTDVSERLSEIRERVEAATEGPWRVEGFNSGRDGGEFKVRGVTQRAGYHRDEEKDRVVGTAPVVPATHRDQAEANARLIASARSDVPYLLSLVERMAGASEEGWQVTEVDDLHPECREVHAEIESWLEQRGLHLDLRDRTVLYQWLDRYARFRVRAALRDAAQEGAE